MATVQNGNKMQGILILTSILTVSAGVIKETCNGVNVNGTYYDLEVLHEDLDRPYLLAVDHSTNILYFSYTAAQEHYDEEDEFKTARINLNTKEFQIIKGINNGFAQTVDRKTDEIYIGGSNGIYKYDYKTDKAELIGDIDNNIWNLYFKDVLYFSVFPSQFLYTFKNGVTSRFKDLEDTKVDNFVIDNDDMMFFTNATGFYSQQKGTKNSVLYKDFPTGSIRALTIDLNGKVHVCLEHGIYVVNKELVALEKVLEIEDAFGLTFDNRNRMIYADATRLVRLNMSKNC